MDYSLLPPAVTMDSYTKTSPTPVKSRLNNVFWNKIFEKELYIYIYNYSAEVLYQYYYINSIRYYCYMLKDIGHTSVLLIVVVYVVYFVVVCVVIVVSCFCIYFGIYI